MNLNRDSLLWTVTFVASVLTFLSNSVGLLHAAFPSLTATGEARITLATAVAGFVAGYFKMSPLPLSQSHPMATNEASVSLSPLNSSKPLALLLLACALASSAACAAHAHPPVGTYSPAGDRALDADNLLKDLVAVSETAVRLNAATGKLHLSDRDTALIRDFALSAGEALRDYGSGASTLQQIRDAYASLMQHISVDGKQHPQIAGTLIAIGVALNQVQ